jgi:hypothetical protein
MILHDAAVVVLIRIGARAGVAPLLGLLGKRVVSVHHGNVPGPQPLVLLPQMRVVCTHSIKAGNGEPALLISLALKYSNCKCTHPHLYRMNPNLCIVGLH